VAIADRTSVATVQGDRWARWRRAVTDPGSELAWEYNGRLDTLYLSLGEPVAAESVHGQHGIVVRLGVETGEVVGIEIQDWERAFMPERGNLKHLWAAIDAPRGPASHTRPVSDRERRLILALEPTIEQEGTAAVGAA
jgi:hypothetical protein